MRTQDKRSWVQLISFAACAGFATTPAFAVEPRTLLQLVQIDDVHNKSGGESNTAIEDRTSGLRVCGGSVRHGAGPQSQVDSEPAENAQSTYLIKLLRGSSHFRVRAQAAFSLGLMEKSFVVRGALTAALQDAHPAVRAAAATALCHMGDPTDVSALRTLAGDDDEPVLQNALHMSPAVLATAATRAARSATTSTL